MFLPPPPTWWHPISFFFEGGYNNFGVREWLSCRYSYVWAVVFFLFSGFYRFCTNKPDCDTSFWVCDEGRFARAGFLVMIPKILNILKSVIVSWIGFHPKVSSFQSWKRKLYFWILDLNVCEIYIAIDFYSIRLSTTCVPREATAMTEGKDHRP